MTMSVLTRAKTAQKKSYTYEEIGDLSRTNVFENIGKSNYTKFPNTLIDLIPVLENSELTVMMYVFRNIFGYGERNYAWVSNEAIVVGTDLSKTTIKESLRSLEKKGLILIQKVISKGIQKQILFLNNDYSKKVLKDFHDHKITVNELLGIKENNQTILQKILSKAKSFMTDSNSSVGSNFDTRGGQNLNERGPDSGPLEKGEIKPNLEYKNIVECPKVSDTLLNSKTDSDQEGVKFCTERGSESGPNKDNINKENYNKEQTTIKEETKILNQSKNSTLANNKKGVVVSFGNFEEEEEVKEAIKILSEATYKNVNIEFNKKIAINVIKKIQGNSEKSILEIIKEKIEYLQFEKINLEIYSPSQVLYKMIIDDRKPTKAYNENKNKAEKSVKVDYYKSLLECFDEYPNNTDEENTKLLIRVNIGKILESVDNFNNVMDKLLIASRIIKLVNFTNKTLEELNIFSPEKLKKIRSIVNEFVENGKIKKFELRDEEKTIHLINFEEKTKSSFEKVSEKLNVVKNYGMVEKLTEMVNSLSKNLSIPNVGSHGIPI